MGPNTKYKLLGRLQSNTQSTYQQVARDTSVFWDSATLWNTNSLLGRIKINTWLASAPASQFFSASEIFLNFYYLLSIVNNEKGLWIYWKIAMKNEFLVSKPIHFVYFGGLLWPFKWPYKSVYFHCCHYKVKQQMDLTETDGLAARPTFVIRLLMFIKNFPSFCKKFLILRWCLFVFVCVPKGW